MIENLKLSDSEDEFVELTWTLRDLMDLLSAGCEAESCVVYVDKVSKSIGVTISTVNYYKNCVFCLLFITRVAFMRQLKCFTSKQKSQK